MMRVAFVAGSAQMGGTERNVLRLAGALLARGIGVEVILLSETGPLMDGFRARRIPVTSVSWSYRARLFQTDLRRLEAVLCASRPDIIHAYGYPTIWWATLAALEAGPAARVIAIQAWDTWKRWDAILLDRLQAPAVHLAIADGEGARRFAVHQQKLPLERTRTVYDGVEPAELVPTRSRESTRASLGVIGNGQAIGMVARLDDVHKGQSVLLRAAPKVLAVVPDATIVFVGDGADRMALEELARELGLAERVRFPGLRTDLGDVLAALDLLVIPSLRFESVPKILVEGMATGHVIVASDVGDIPELLEAGRSGWLVPPGDPSKLATAIVASLADPAGAAALGAAARKAVMARGLTLEATAESLERLYAELIRGGPSPPPPGVSRRVRMAAWIYVANQAWRARRRQLACAVGKSR